MKSLTLMAALAALGFAVNANAANDDLERRVTASDGWVAYHVPLLAGADGPCCYSVRRSGTTKGCDLDQRNGGFNNDHADPTEAIDDTLAVYLKVEHGRVERVRGVAASCPVRTASTVQWIEAVDPASSIAMLSSLLERKSGDAEDNGLIALAHHADAYPHILKIAHNSPAEHVRGQAFFWLAQIGDARAKNDILASLKAESSDEVREQAVFALSQLRDGGGDEALITVLRGDYSRTVKKQAMFWLGQSGSPQAMAYFDEALK